MDKQESSFNKDTFQIENAQEAISEGMLPKNWSDKVINSILWGNSEGAVTRNKKENGKI